MANKTTLDLLTEHMRKNDMEVGEGLDLVCSFVDEFNYAGTFQSWLVSGEADVQRPLRVKVWQTLREMIEGSVDTSRALRSELFNFRLELRKESRPWDEAVLGRVENVLANASNEVGDHPLFNKGGQGYKALKKLRAPR